ncbi:RidA family protein [Mariluticola halotolerans]|uniref:RidA family protein n=1 Tax=Mariluticola halotolerans TaxID=2909283 RepID=UPI0026E407D6|nr:RidA family protein [Mariluticola halotolerans]UJQ93651.1 RidA family protein [Mariluticola halotolerans]
MVKHISSGSPFEAKIGYARAVVDKDMIYVSGTTGYDYANMVMPADVGAQARNALATIGKALEEAGSSLKDVVRVRYYLADASLVDGVIEAVGPVFTEIRPAATMVIATMIEDAMKIEIEVTARIGAHAS